MIARLKLTLDQPEYSALLQAALADLRTPADQARFLLRQALEQRGLLSSQNPECRRGLDNLLADSTPDVP